MQLPDVDASSAVYAKHTDHFEGAVEGWSDAEIITEDQRKAVVAAGASVGSAGAALRATVMSYDAAEHEATKRRARYLIRDIVLDMRIMTVSDAVLNGPAMRNRQHPIYKTVFQEGNASEITESKLREEPEIAERVRDRLAAVEDFEGKARVKSDLDEALAKSFSARDALDAAEMAENKAGDGEIHGRLGVRTALEQAYGNLRAAFPGQRKLVESFFLKRERTPKKGKGDDGGKPDEG
jgi:hypothetical protein